MTHSIALPLEVTDIAKLLPHRYPFVFLDRVTHFSPFEQIIGVKNVTANEFFFQGHFPDRPIMPGVLILEALAQLGAIFARLCANELTENALIVFSGADHVRFRRVVIPGDVLTLECNDCIHRSGHWKMRGIARVGEERAAEAILKATGIRGP